MTPTPSAPWTPASRWVRITSEHASGLVEFEFAVGEPGLYVELVMQRSAFDDFCRAQQVQPTQGPLPGAAADSGAQDWDWNLRQARAQHARPND